MGANDYVIITDSTSDLPIEIINALGIYVVPMPFTLSGVNYLHYPDGRELDINEFYARLRLGDESFTTLINTQSYIEYFEPIINAKNHILYISFSSALSGSYNSSLLAANELMEKYPKSKIICIDSKAASLGEGLLVYSAAMKKEEGFELEELGEWITNNRSQLCHWFTVADLNYLKRGGRVTAMSATVGTALNIKPILHVDDEGYLKLIDKVRGRKRALKSLVDHMIETSINPEEQTIFIGHGGNLYDSELLVELIKDKINVKNVIINNIGPTIGTHSGPDTIALFFFGSKR
ncbi:MAG: DegV family protein [Clostridiaceae bacterium]